MSAPVDLVRAALEQAWAADCQSDIYLARRVVELRERVAVLRAAPGGAALDSAVDALLQQADVTGDSDLAPVAEWLRRVSALDEDES